MSRKLLGCKFGGAVEASEFVQRGFRFRVERPYLSEEFALSERKLALRLRAAQFGCLNAALRWRPVPDGNGSAWPRQKTEIRNF